MILKKIKNKIFKNYSTDIALRYLPVADILEEINKEHEKILEVGSGDLGITPYYKEKITGIDIKYNKEKNELLKKIYYNGKVFPFKEDEFDITISVDNIEHLPNNNRKDFIKEILRVTKKTILLVIPCGRLSYEQDIKLFQYFFKIHKKKDRFFSDHIKNGLPEIKDVILMLEISAKELNKSIKILKKDNLLNLKIRYFIMKCKISNNLLLSTLYYIFLLVLPIRKMLNFGNCYRQILYIKII
jgi:SAM-dependent methyltransferase